MSATALPQARPAVPRSPAHLRARSRVRPHPSAATVNVGDAERWLSLVGGGVLGVLGVSRGSLGGLALAAVGGALVYRGLSGHCSLYQALDLNTAQPRGPATSVPAAHGFKFEHSVTINRPAADLYRFWRDFSNLPRIMRHLESVRSEGQRSHWEARGPLGLTVSWDAEIINERPNELIAWRSLEGSSVDTAGSVHFQTLSHNRGTEVRVSLKYNPPAGKVGAWAASLFGKAPEQEIREDLGRFKRFMEAGEEPTSAGQPQSQGR